MICVRIDWLKDGRLKIKLTNIRIRKKVQNVCMIFGYIEDGKMKRGSKNERRKEGRREGRKKR